MDENTAPLTPGALHAQRDWVRRVARALVADPSAADDLEQEVWVKALEKRPVVRRSLRAWLGTVLRNAAVDRHRADRRRATHEAAAVPAEEAAPSPLDLVARAEAIQRVGAAVLALREPYRTTILLRYFEDLSPAEIARRLDVPRETVRTRLHRGLAELRDRLDVGPEGERRGWILFLALPPGEGAGAAPIPTAFGGESGAWSGADQAARESWGTVREVLIMGAKATFAAGLATGGVAGVLLGIVPQLLEPEEPPAAGAPGIHAAAPGLESQVGATLDLLRRDEETFGRFPPKRNKDVVAPKEESPREAPTVGDVTESVARKEEDAARDIADARERAEMAARTRAAAEAIGKETPEQVLARIRSITRKPNWERKEPPDVTCGLSLVEGLLRRNLEPEERARVLVEEAILRRMESPPNQSRELDALVEASNLQTLDTETGREVHFQLAWTRSRAGDDREAAEIFDRVASHPSTHPGIRATTRWEAAVRADRIGERESARRWYEEFVRNYEGEQGRWHKECVAKAKERLKEL